MKNSTIAVCYSAYINEDCTPKDLAESILEVNKEFKESRYDVKFYVTIFDPKEQNAVSVIKDLRNKHQLSLRILEEPLDSKYKSYCTKGHSMSNGAIISYLDGCDFIGFMDGDETIPDGKFPYMLKSMKKYNADICFVDIPRSVFSGLITNSLLIYFTCYLDYRVPGFISGYYLLTKDLAKKLFHIKNEEQIKEELDNTIDISPNMFIKLSDSLDSSIENYRTWAIDTSIVVLSLLEHHAKCCAAQVTPKVDRSAVRYGDAGVGTIEKMFNELIGGIARLVALLDINKRTPMIPKKPPTYGDLEKEIEHKPVDTDPYKKIVEKYNNYERKDEYEKIVSICPSYFETEPNVANLDIICKNHGQLLRKLISDIDKRNYRFIGRCLVTACMQFMILRVELLKKAYVERKELEVFANEIQSKVTDTLVN
ncbi:MAG: hypothetical protein ACFFA5_11130 [Promethearchaeota archaeon]